MKSNDSKVGASGVLKTLDYVKKVGNFFYIPYFTIISGCGNELFYAVMHYKFKFFPHVIYRIFGECLHLTYVWMTAYEKYASLSKSQ